MNLSTIAYRCRSFRSRDSGLSHFRRSARSSAGTSCRPLQRGTAAGTFEGLTPSTSRLAACVGDPRPAATAQRFAPQFSVRNDDLPHAFRSRATRRQHPPAPLKPIDQGTTGNLHHRAQLSPARRTRPLPSRRVHAARSLVSREQFYEPATGGRLRRRQRASSGIRVNS
jgi:hypothetical protein